MYLASRQILDKWIVPIICVNDKMGSSLLISIVKISPDRRPIYYTNRLF